MPQLPACPDRCGGRAEYQHTTSTGAAEYRCTRCGEVWWVLPENPRLFDPEAGAEARDTGMALAAEAQGEAWATWARRQLRYLAATGQPFTADDLVALADHAARQPTHRNAIGAAFNAAARQGLIAATGTTKRTDQAAGHRRRQLVWRGVQNPPHE